MKLLTEGASSPKLKKQAEALGIECAILHLAPAREAGRENVCPFASKGCLASCLNRAGRGQMTSVQAARIRRTRMLYDDPDAFYDLLDRDLTTLRKRAERNGRAPWARLNGTSDLDWFGLFPKLWSHSDSGVRFWDYTKDQYAARTRPPHLLDQYHGPVDLTYSRSENYTDESIDALLGEGVRVAAVFERLPKQWLGREVLNGDRHDFRFLEPRGALVGLTPKGPAKRDTSGFVIREGYEGVEW